MKKKQLNIHYVSMNKKGLKGASVQGFLFYINVCHD